MSAELSYRSYRWHGGDEWLAEIGHGPPVLLVPPLFEELNRCRAFLARIMRALAEAGLKAVLPDLPGTGESPRALSDADWGDWTGALGLLSFDLKARVQVPLIASFRGGCLLEERTEAVGTWRFAPAAGSALVRDLVRAKQATMPDKPRADVIEAGARDATSEFAGYMITPSVFASLRDAALPDRDALRTVRLDSDPAPADFKVQGKPLWRQSEPGNDLALADVLAADIVGWRRACAG